MGSTPDGVYEFSDEATRVLDQLSREELIRVQRIVTKAQQEATPPSELAEMIRREVPSASAVANLLADKRLVGLVAILALLLQWKAYRLQVQQAKTPPKPPVIIINDSDGREEHSERPRTPHSGREKTTLRPTDPCWCGSGSNYKHCHGRR